jgi:hypothetical protein
MYKIKITKIIDNPNFDEEARKENIRSIPYGRHDYQPEIMDKTMEVEVISAELTQEEFCEAKKAIISAVK